MRSVFWSVEGCEFLQQPKSVRYPCEWKPSIAPSEAFVTIAFGPRTVSLNAPIGAIDSSTSTVRVDIVAYCGPDYLVSLPGETDSLGQVVRVPRNAFAVAV